MTLEVDKTIADSPPSSEVMRSMPLRFQESQRAGTSPVTTPEVSVIVPAYRGAAMIASCLESILRATRSRCCEIIVVESSADGAADIVRSGFPEVRLVESPHRLSAGAARNEGFRHARGRFVLCVDQDCNVPDDWVERLVGLLDREGVAAAGGSIAVANPWNIPGWCVYFLEFFTHFPGRGTPRLGNFLIGANSGYRPELVGDTPFPDQTLGEDLLASDHVRDAGFLVLYDPTLTVHHRNRSGWREFVNYCRAMGRAAAATRSRQGGQAIETLRAVPVLAFGIPLVILPRIAWSLLLGTRAYLPIYIALLPCCAIGSFVWAYAFRRALLESRARFIAAS